MVDGNGREEWAEARSLLYHRIKKLEAASEEAQRQIIDQDKKILVLQMRMGALSAAIAFVVSILPWILDHLGFGFGKK